MQTDRLVRATAADGTVRCMAAVTTNLVAEAARRHATSPTVSAVLLGVFMRARDTGEAWVEAAGGLVIQMMPGADEKIIANIEASVHGAPHTTTLIREGAGPRELLSMALGGLSFEMLDEKPVS